MNVIVYLPLHLTIKWHYEKNIASAFIYTQVTIEAYKFKIEFEAI